MLTQNLSSNTNADAGSAVNMQGAYSPNKWFSAGLTLEWERHAVHVEQPSEPFGYLDTVLVLPTVELRPTKYSPLASSALDRIRHQRQLFCGEYQQPRVTEQHVRMAACIREGITP